MALSATALKDATRRQGGGLGPSLTAVAGNAGDDCDRDKKTAHQPNQKTRKMTAIFAEARSKGIDTGRPVTEARDNPVYLVPRRSSTAGTVGGLRHTAFGMLVPVV